MHSFGVILLRIQCLLGNENPAKTDLNMRKYGTRLLEMITAVGSPAMLDSQLISAIQFENQQAVPRTEPYAFLDIHAFYTVFANHFGFDVFIVDDVRNLSPVNYFFFVFCFFCFYCALIFI